MGSASGLIAFAFVVLIVVIVFLMFQVYENSNRGREMRIQDQERIEQAARAVIESKSTKHPYFAMKHAMRAEFIMEDLLMKYGGLTGAERELKVSGDRLENLRKNTYDQNHVIAQDVTDAFARMNPSLNFDINQEAGLSRTSKSRGQKRKKKE